MKAIIASYDINKMAIGIDILGKRYGFSLPKPKIFLINGKKDYERKKK